MKGKKENVCNVVTHELFIFVCVGFRLKYPASYSSFPKLKSITESAFGRISFRGDLSHQIDTVPIRTYVLRSSHNQENIVSGNQR